MAVTQKVTLYNNKFTVSPVINAVQNDTDRQVEAYFGDFTLQVGMTGKLSFIRSDGTHYEVSATLNTGANTATAELDQALTQAGATQAQLKITDSGNVGSTFTFMIKVQPDVAGISVEQDGWSAEEFNERLTTAEQDIEDLAEEVDTDYAKKVGSYDNLSAGTASGIIGKSGETDTVPYTYRAIPHDSTREVMRKIVGSTVAWNQIFPSTARTNTNNEVTYTRESSGKVTVNGTATATSVWNAIQPTDGIFPIQNNHVYVLNSDSQSVEMGCFATSGGSTTSIPDTRSRGTFIRKITYGGTYTRTWVRLIVENGVTVNSEVIYPQIIDLTAMLGTAIADYVYGLETATAGAGVEWLKEHFPKAFNTYQPYDAGSLKSVEGLVSHDTVGFNQWDEDWELGLIGKATGENQYSTLNIRSKNYIPVTPSTNYFYHFGDKPNWAAVCIYYDKNKNWIGYPGEDGYCGNVILKTPDNCHYIRFYCGQSYGTTYNHDICINLSDQQRNGQYEPYQKHSYPLDPTQELRGIFKLDASNNLYADGDEWYADGRKNVRYGIVDLGTLTWNIVTSGTYNRFYSTEVNIAKPASSQSAVANVVSDRYVSNSFSNLSTTDKAIAINTNGAINVTDSAYETAAAFKTAMSGVKIVVELATPTESTAPAFADVQIIDPDGTEEFVTDCIVAVGNETFYADNLVGKLDDLPNLPVEAGTYRLKVTVTAGVPSYEWVTT